MRIGIIGASGYAGGELLRILLYHPKIEITTVMSRSNAGEFIFRVHHNLRNVCKLKFSPMDLSEVSKKCEIVFVAVPHGASLNIIPKLLEIGVKVIDLSADFRLKEVGDYEKWYGWKHTRPDLLKEAVYGLPELHREEIKRGNLISCPGCMATASILGLAPLIKSSCIEKNRIVIDTKIGSSGGGAKPTLASHHPERFSGVRAYNVFGHRHIAEIEQELNLLSDAQTTISFTPHAVNMVRGILATIHVFVKKNIEILDVWKMYRSLYQNEPFVRLVRDNKGLNRLPDPKIVIGSNFCDIGFEIDNHIDRMVVLSAIDNLVKGASGQAVQCLNIILGVDERTGLELPGFHPM